MKRDKYENFAGELKTLWNMKVTVIPIVVGALGIILKELGKGQEDLSLELQRKAITLLWCEKLSKE